MISPSELRACIESDLDAEISYAFTEERKEAKRRAKGEYLAAFDALLNKAQWFDAWQAGRELRASFRAPKLVDDVPPLHSKPIYQVTEDDAAWHDTDWMTYDSTHFSQRRIVYEAQPVSAAPSTFEERAAFESWWLRDVPENHRSFAKTLLDGYGPDYTASPSVADAWTAWKAARASQSTPPIAVSYLPPFPTMLRKMWSGSEVQAWIDGNIKPVVQERHFEHHCGPTTDVSDETDFHAWFNDAWDAFEDKEICSEIKAKVWALKAYRQFAGAAMPQADVRASFEAWADTADMPLGMYSASDYADGATQISWDAWQACALQSSPDAIRDMQSLDTKRIEYLYKYSHPLEGPVEIFFDGGHHLFGEGLLEYIDAEIERLDRGDKS